MKHVTQAKLSEALLRELPKSDLHLHLDGSLRPQTLIELADERGVRLPARTPAGLERKVFKQNYRDLPEYLKGFALTCAVLTDAAALERASYELCRDNQAEGVRYIEIRFAPQLHVRPGFSLRQVLKAVARGIRRAEKKFNQRAVVRDGSEPDFRAGIIVCAMRFFTRGFSPAFEALFEALPGLPAEQIHHLASENLVQEAVQARDEDGLPVVGVDLAGQERGFPAKAHRRAYGIAHDHFLGKTVHAGEDYGPESIFQAITDCRADRIGHGTWLFHSNRLADPRVTDRKAYVEKLVRYVAERRITLEICLTSNQQTSPSLAELRRHPLRRMLDQRLSVTLCSDNRLVSRTTMTAEYQKAVDSFHISPTRLRRMLVYGFKRCFFPGSYRDKRAYVRRILDYRDVVFARHGFDFS